MFTALFGQGGMEVLFILVVLILIGYGVFCLYMITNHPALWQQMQQHAHERRLHAQQNRQAEEARRHEKDMAARARNRQTVDVLSMIWRMFR